jgi:hypothetical protein
MMHDRQKSHSAIVAAKPTHKNSRATRGRLVDEPGSAGQSKDKEPRPAKLVAGLSNCSGQRLQPPQPPYPQLGNFVVSIDRCRSHLLIPKVQSGSSDNR